MLDRPYHDQISGVGGNQPGDHADERARIGAEPEFTGRGPADDRGHDHDPAMGEIEHAGNAEDQREADGGEAIERADRKSVDKDLDCSHRSPTALNKSPNDRDAFGPPSTAKSAAISAQSSCGKFNSVF